MNTGPGTSTIASAAARRASAAYRSAISATRARVLAFIDGAWTSLPDYREADVDRFAAAAVPVVAGAQRQVAALTAAFFATLERDATGKPVAPLGIPATVVSIDAIRGVAGVDVYRRAGVEVWRALAGGAKFADAVGRGRDRARVMAETDVQLAKTHAGRFIAETRDAITGYRRVPEAGACSLCIGASRRTYATGALMPIHARCDCDVEPIFGARDLGPTRSVAGDAEDLTVHSHGELGPVLTPQGEGFTTTGSL